MKDDIELGDGPLDLSIYQTGSLFISRRRTEVEGDPQPAKKGLSFLKKHLRESEVPVSRALGRARKQLREGRTEIGHGDVAPAPDIAPPEAQHSSPPEQQIAQPTATPAEDPAPAAPRSEEAVDTQPKAPAPEPPKVIRKEGAPGPDLSSEKTIPPVGEPVAQTAAPAELQQDEAESPGPQVEARVKAPDVLPPEEKGGAVAKGLGTEIDGEAGAVVNPPKPPAKGGGGGGGGTTPPFHKRMGGEQFSDSLTQGVKAVRRNLTFVMVLTCATNVLILAIPIYLFQISDRVLTSRSIDTLIMLTIVIGGAVVLQAVLDAVRRFILMRTAVEVAARLGAPILSAAAHAALHTNGKEYQTLTDLQQVRGFLVSSTLISFLDVPFAPLFILAIFMVHPHLGLIVVATALTLLVIAIINQKVTSKPFAVANQAQTRANLHLNSMTRNSQIINAMAMVPEAVRMWGKDTAASLKEQVKAQDRNIISAACSRAVRLMTQILMLGWGAYLAIDGQITGGMVIAASIIAGRALSPIEGSIEGWNAFLLSRSAYDRIRQLMNNTKQKFERLRLPEPKGRLDVERLLYVPGGTKQVVLNGISFSLEPGETLGVIGSSGAGKTTLGKMLVGSLLPTSGNVRLDIMDIRNWDPRQFGENIGYLPQDVQLFPGTIKSNIARMREDATDEQIHHAAVLADVHDMISNMPQGYETVVAADGAPLSGGQRQRIALARAFFGSPKLLVLDEPNSNLDTAGDRALAKAITQAKASGISVVAITQKPALLQVVDKVMVLNQGSIALFGTRAQVLAQLEKRKKNNGGGGQQIPQGGPDGLPSPA